MARLIIISLLFCIFSSSLGLSPIRKDVGTKNEEINTSACSTPTIPDIYEDSSDSEVPDDGEIDEAPAGPSVATSAVTEKPRITGGPYPAQLLCGQNEEERCVANCPLEKTCRNRNVNIPCRVNSPCASQCVCSFGYYRNDNGQCVTAGQCKQEPTDSDLPIDDNGIAPFSARSGSAQPAGPGYVGPDGEYPWHPPPLPVLPTCVTNEELRCVANCPLEKTCRNRNINIPCRVTSKCARTCVCKFGYYRDDSGTCVTAAQCRAQELITDSDQPIDGNVQPLAASSAPAGRRPPPSRICARNEELQCVKRCGPEKTCKNRFIKYRCILDRRPCTRQCVCKPGYFRNAIGECVSAKECDLCPKPHEYFTCGGACDNVCSTLKFQSQTNCPIVNIVCNRMCYCESGYARDSKGNCIPIDQCPSLPSPFNVPKYPIHNYPRPPPYQQYRNPQLYNAVRDSYPTAKYPVYSRTDHNAILTNLQQVPINDLNYDRPYPVHKKIPNGVVDGGVKWPIRNGLNNINRQKILSQPVQRLPLDGLKITQNQYLNIPNKVISHRARPHYFQESPLLRPMFKENINYNKKPYTNSHLNVATSTTGPSIGRFDPPIPATVKKSNGTAMAGTFTVHKKVLHSKVKDDIELGNKITTVVPKGTEDRYFATSANPTETITAPKTDSIKKRIENIVSNSNLRDLMSRRKSPSRFIVVYPNGTIELVNTIRKVADKHPNYVLVQAGELVPQSIPDIKHNNIDLPATPATTNLNSIKTSSILSTPSISNIPISNKISKPEVSPWVNNTSKSKKNKYQMRDEKPLLVKLKPAIESIPIEITPKSVVQVSLPVKKQKIPSPLFEKKIRPNSTIGIKKSPIALNTSVIPVSVSSKDILKNRNNLSPITVPSPLVTTTLSTLGLLPVEKLPNISNITNTLITPNMEKKNGGNVPSKETRRSFPSIVDPTLVDTLLTKNLISNKSRKLAEVPTKNKSLPIVPNVITKKIYKPLVKTTIVTVTDGVPKISPNTASTPNGQPIGVVIKVQEEGQLPVQQLPILPRLTEKLINNTSIKPVEVTTKDESLPIVSKIINNKFDKPLTKTTVETVTDGVPKISPNTASPPNAKPIGVVIKVQEEGQLPVQQLPVLPRLTEKLINNTSIKPVEVTTKDESLPIVSKIINNKFDKPLTKTTVETVTDGVPKILPNTAPPLIMQPIRVAITVQEEGQLPAKQLPMLPRPTGKMINNPSIKPAEVTTKDKSLPIVPNVINNKFDKPLTKTTVEIVTDGVLKISPNTAPPLNKQPIGVAIKVQEEGQLPVKPLTILPKLTESLKNDTQKKPEAVTTNDKIIPIVPDVINNKIDKPLTKIATETVTDGVPNILPNTAPPSNEQPIGRIIQVQKEGQLPVKQLPILPSINVEIPSSLMPTVIETTPVSAPIQAGPLLLDPSKVDAVGENQLNVTAFPPITASIPMPVANSSSPNIELSTQKEPKPLESNSTLPLVNSTTEGTNQPSTVAPIIVQESSNIELSPQEASKLDSNSTPPLSLSLPFVNSTTEGTKQIPMVAPIIVVQDSSNITDIPTTPMPYEENVPEVDIFTTTAPKSGSTDGPLDLPFLFTGFDISQVNTDEKPLVWMKSTNESFWNKLSDGKEDVDIVYFFQINTPPKIENTITRTLFPNGTILEEVTKIVWSPDTDERTVTKTTKLINDES